MSSLVRKPTKWHVRQAKTQISLGIRPLWSESSLSAWRKLGSLATYWANSEDSDQTGWMPRLIWVFAGRTATLLVLSWGGSYILLPSDTQSPLWSIVTYWNYVQGCCGAQVQLKQIKTDKIWAALWQSKQCGCAPSEDSDQPGHPPSLIRVLAVRSMGS